MQHYRPFPLQNSAWRICNVTKIWASWILGRSTFIKIVHECACWTSNWSYFIPILHYHLPSIVHHFQKKSTIIMLKLGAFHHNLLKLQPIYVIWALLSLIKIHRSLYQISGNSTSKGRHIRMPCHCEYPLQLEIRINRPNNWLIMSVKSIGSGWY